MAGQRSHAPQTVARDRAGPGRPGPRLTRLLLAVALATGLAGCGLFDSKALDRTAKMTPEQLYAEARDEMRAGRYGEAIKMLGLLESRYPFGTWAQQAQLDTAYSHYRQNERTQALVAIERFMRLHPNSDHLDYAYYLKGLINFNDEFGLMAKLGGQDLAERDPRAARESFEAFRQVVTRFPESRYAEDAHARMSFLVNTLASGDVHVARFYYLRGAYVAAANRAQDVVQQYQQTPAVEEALFILMKSYEKLGLDALRADTERVLRSNFPQSRFFTEGIATNERAWWQVWR